MQMSILMATFLSLSMSWPSSLSLAGPAWVQPTAGSELCGDSELMIAQQYDKAVIIIAIGKHPTAGFVTSLEQLPIDVYPPEFELRHVKPTGPTNQVITPFIVGAGFPAPTAIKEVVITDAKGRHKISVLPIATGKSSYRNNTTKYLADECSAHSNLSVFSKLLAATDLNEVLKSNGPFTVFAPDDSGFTREQIRELSDPANKPKLIAFLNLHIKCGQSTVAETEQVRSFHTWGGHVYVHPGKGLSTDGSNIIGYVTMDDYCGNGILHVLKKPLPPPRP